MLKQIQMEARQSLTCIRAVEAVKQVDAWKRKPESLKHQTFFGEYDLWHYKPVFDKKLCQKCLEHAIDRYFVGSELIGTFKYLRIIDANKIEANVHPHCRCILTRITDPLEYLWVTRKIFD